MNIQLLGIGSRLHSFADDERQERRQYPRIQVRFALWWLKDLRGSEPVPGLGIEISGGGLQFLLHQKVGSQCSLAFEIHGRRMRASVDVLQSTEMVFEGQPWQHYPRQVRRLAGSRLRFHPGFGAEAGARHFGRIASII